MNLMFRFGLIFIGLIIFTVGATAQIDDICGETGATPGLDSPFAHVPYVYGRVSLKGFDASARPPKVVVSLVDGSRSAERWTIDKSGNYCFKRKSNGGEIFVEVNGIETVRRTLASFGSPQQREDFEIFSTNPSIPPGVISAKFTHPRNEKTVELYQKTLDAEGKKDPDKAIDYLRDIVSLDSADFIAWAKLGSLYLAQNKLPDADAAFRKSLELKVEYTPAWITVGQLRIAQKQYEAAIEILKHAAELGPSSARVFQLLGEAYLLARKGALGAETLNQAIKLDPIGMAECHLQLAHLYELAGAKQMATREYKLFLTKVPTHPDKKKLEKFIKDNPE